MTDAPLPFRPGDWVTDENDRIAKVKSVWRAGGEVLLDLWLHTHGGIKTGRETPAMGGPKTFEPACPADGWSRVAKPSFPIRLQWVTNDQGQRIARYYAGDPLPPANWTPKPRGGAVQPPNEGYLRRALREIADGHNDARQRARDALEGKTK